MDNVKIYSYSSRSEGAVDLARALECDIILSSSRPARDKIIINWGSGHMPFTSHNTLNSKDAVNRSINKIDTFTALRRAGVPHPEWTTSRTEAQRWLTEGSRVCVRTEVEGADGAGLTIVNPVTAVQQPAGGRWWAQPPVRAIPVLPSASLYTKFMAASDEYRVNVCCGEVMGVQSKVRASDFRGTLNPDIKTSSGGYGFHLMERRDWPAGIGEVAINAVNALDLDFGGIDIIRVGARYYVLESNTAPTLTPAMVTAYANRFRQVCAPRTR